MFLGLSVVGHAQMKVWDVFTSMPDTLCPFVDLQNRVCMVRIAGCDTVPNRLDGVSYLIDQTKYSLRVQIADGVEYGLLLHNDTITFIQTVCAPVCASIVKQYDSEWHYLQTITPPLKGVFVEAMLQDSAIIYKDNTPELLDEDEKKAYQR